MTTDQTNIRRKPAQINVRISDDLKKAYEEVLDKEGIKLTEDLERYIKQRVGWLKQDEGLSSVNEVLAQHQQAIAELKDAVGKLSVA
jgi:hypothetical protein